MKKTPFQRAKEAQERKKREEEAEAAKVYEDFVESFGEGSEDKDASNSFASGGVVEPGQNPNSAPGGIRKGNVRYKPSFMPPSMAASLKKEPESIRQEEPINSLPSSRNDRGKTRNIDKMLETMKREQEIRTERQRQRRERGTSFEPGFQHDDGLGSFDDGDPFTTNLYVGNLAPEVDEEVLKREFVRYGDIASIKVMWPRDVAKPKGRNCGFVAFMTRQSAERAKDELNGVLLKDVDLKIGWGKAVVLPPMPLYTASGTGGLSGMIAAAKAAVAQVAPPGQIPPPGWSIGPPPQREADPHSGQGPDIVVKAPEDLRLRFIIDSVAMYVMVDGCAFEQALMTQKAQNSEFMFLFDLSSPEHAYYRWRVYSLAQGDDLRSWRNEPFVMLEGGPKWIPPTMTEFSDGRQQTAAQRGGEAKEKDRPLSDAQRDKFEDLLRALTMERSKICEAMVFSLDNAESASEIVEILTDSLTLMETPMTTKVARLMLVSDVLHNSSAHVPKASRYRSLLESCLAEIFESLQETNKTQESRIKQEVLRRNVLKLLRIWRSWFIFSDDFLNGLQATFLESTPKQAENPELKAELENLDDESLAVRCRRNGLVRSGDRNSQIQSLINLQAYLSGEKEPDSSSMRQIQKANITEPPPKVELKEDKGLFEMELPDPSISKMEQKKEDLPLEPPKAEVKEPEKPKVEGPVSKWTLVDYDDESAAFPQQPEANEDIFTDLDKAPILDSGRAPDPNSSPEPEVPVPISPQKGRENAENRLQESRSGAQRNDAAEDQKRARLRQVEVDLLVFRESLEDQGLPASELEAKIQTQRSKLIARAERGDTSQTFASDRQKEGEEDGEIQGNTSSKGSHDKSKSGGKQKLGKDSVKDKQEKSSKRSRSRSRSIDRHRDRHKDSNKSRKRARSKSLEKTHSKDSSRHDSYKHREKESGHRKSSKEKSRSRSPRDSKKSRSSKRR